MSTIGNARARWVARSTWTVVLSLSMLPAVACTSQPATSVKPDAAKSQSAGKPADSSVAPLPAATLDSRDLVRRRMELCQYRPEICVQRGKDNERPEANEPRPPARDD